MYSICNLVVYSLLDNHCGKAFVIVITLYCPEIYKLNFLIIKSVYISVMRSGPTTMYGIQIFANGCKSAFATELTLLQFLPLLGDVCTN
jgi:hypothetical protein